MKLFIALTILTSACIAGKAISQLPSETHFNYSIIFCNSVNCSNEFISYIGNSEKEIRCALYSVDTNILSVLKDKSEYIPIHIITNNNKHQTDSKLVFKRKSTGLMHNKFCVFDQNVVWTGSFNPKHKKSIDNVMIINSSNLAQNYLEEFNDLKTTKSIKTTSPKIILNTTMAENYFCPEDSCIDLLKNKLSDAQNSIYFAAYSFTHPRIANELIIKSAQGLDIKGIIEKGTKYSQLKTLRTNNIDAIEHSSKSIMHHKFFIIDNKTVITGSLNPTKNGNTRNDENLLIIHNEDVAAIYLEQFSIIWGETY